MNFKNIRVKAFAVVLFIAAQAGSVSHACEQASCAYEVATDFAIGAAAGALPVVYLFTHLEDLLTACNDGDPIFMEGVSSCVALTAIAALPVMFAIQDSKTSEHRLLGVKSLASIFGTEAAALTMLCYRQYQARKKYEEARAQREAQEEQTIETEVA